MSESNMIRARRLPDGSIVQELPDGSTRPFQSRTNWARLEAMTEEEIEANALADPESMPYSPEELTAMQSALDPRSIRRRLHLTQEEFAARFGVPLGTLRDWEQGASTPDTAARTLLRVIDKHPEAVIDALAG